jgi:hypothetical protein
MKIRIQGNSIRLRLTKIEVDQFASRGVVQEKVNFGNSVLTYKLRSSIEKKVTASFINDIITISVPEEIGEKWTKSEEVGFNEVLNNPDDEKLSILVEKDFQCLVPRADDGNDLFPNPLANKD